MNSSANPSIVSMKGSSNIRKCRNGYTSVTIEIPRDVFEFTKISRICAASPHWEISVRMPAVFNL